MLLAAVDHVDVLALWCWSRYVRPGCCAGSGPLQPSVKRPFLFGVVPDVSAGAPGVDPSTVVVHDFVVSKPRCDTAVRSTVCCPVWLVSIGTVPLGSVARPEYGSDAVTVAAALEPSRAVAGHWMSS